jgi:2-haloalkanoic acid dehalogenase type II
MKMTKSLTDFTVLTFDCYGTLIDWETGIWDALQPLLMENGCEEVTRASALEAFGAEEADQEARTPSMPYPEVLARVHRALAKRFGLLTREELDSTFGASLPHWPAFADTAAALRALKRRYRLVILSNVHRDGIAASNRKLGVRFDAIYTAEEIGSYKPSPRNFEYMLERLEADHGIAPNQILHTAQSLFHDHVPARVFGLANCWIDRQGLSRGGDWGATAKVREQPDVDFLYPSLGALAEAVEASR